MTRRRKYCIPSHIADSPGQQKVMRRRSGSVPCLQRKPLESSTNQSFNSLQKQNQTIQSSASNIPKLISRERRASICDPSNPRPTTANTQSAFKALKIQQPVSVLRQSLDNLSKDLNLSLDTISMLSRQEVYRRMEVEYEAMKKVVSPKTAIVSPFLTNTNKEDEEVTDDPVFSSKSNNRKLSSSQSSMNKSLPIQRTPSPRNNYQRSMSVALVPENVAKKQRKTSVDFRYNAPLITGRSALIKSNRPMSAKPRIGQ